MHYPAGWQSPTACRAYAATLMSCKADGSNPQALDHLRPSSAASRTCSYAVPSRVCPITHPTAPEPPASGSCTAKAPPPAGGPTCMPAASKGHAGVASSNLPGNRGGFAAPDPLKWQNNLPKNQAVSKAVLGLHFTSLNDSTHPTEALLCQRLKAGQVIFMHAAFEPAQPRNSL